MTVDASTDDRPLLAVGTAVTIEFGDGTSVDGTVSEQMSVPQDDGSTSVPLDDRAGRRGVGRRDERQDRVDATLASDVMIVPVGGAAGAGRGRLRGRGRRRRRRPGLVAVDVGEILDGQAEISGDVDVGDTVLVAR